MKLDISTKNNYTADSIVFARDLCNQMILKRVAELFESEKEQLDFLTKQLSTEEINKVYKNSTHKEMVNEALWELECNHYTTYLNSGMDIAERDGYLFINLLLLMECGKNVGQYGSIWIADSIIAKKIIESISLMFEHELISKNKTPRMTDLLAAQVSGVAPDVLPNPIYNFIKDIEESDDPIDYLSFSDPDYHLESFYYYNKNHSIPYKEIIYSEKFKEWCYEVEDDAFEDLPELVNQFLEEEDGSFEEKIISIILADNQNPQHITEEFITTQRFTDGVSLFYNIEKEA